MDIITAYETLRLSNDASFDEIKTAYRQLSLQCHPDRNPNKSTVDFLKIKQAYNKLSEFKQNDSSGNVMLLFVSSLNGQISIEKLMYFYKISTMS